MDWISSCYIEGRTLFPVLAEVKCNTRTFVSFMTNVLATATAAAARRRRREKGKKVERS